MGLQRLLGRNVSLTVEHCTTKLDSWLNFSNLYCRCYLLYRDYRTPNTNRGTRNPTYMDVVSTLLGNLKFAYSIY
ncbi:hypothetical protein Tsubulata_024689 [Turnera subulata]|uniref:Uncharacterized protein n=1 Tax=Turnera subulata TaxID=218843 RepID=A0A9Q0F3L1_9ROSI|nr:hypothetical protein Tsubulata_024689 [Turnera subulata]